MVDEALTMDAEYIFFIEDDTIPPPGALLELGRVLETSDASVMTCGGIYTTRNNPPEPIVYMGPGKGAHWNWRLGDIFECWATGMGCTMIKMEVFKQMPKPWFKELKTLEEVEEYADLFPEFLSNEGKIRKIGVSTDLFFFSKLAKYGYKALAHGGVLPIHWDTVLNTGYWIPKGTPPVKDVMVNNKPFGWVDASLNIPESAQA